MHTYNMDIIGRCLLYRCWTCFYQSKACGQIHRVHTEAQRSVGLINRAVLNPSVSASKPTRVPESDDSPYVSVSLSFFLSTLLSSCLGSVVSLSPLISLLFITLTPSFFCSSFHSLSNLLFYSLLTLSRASLPPTRSPQLPSPSVMQFITACYCDSQLDCTVTGGSPSPAQSTDP